MGFAALLSPIIAELGLSFTRAGVLASAFFGAYALMQIPAGLLGDRFGRRRVLVLGLVAGGLASLSTGLAVSFATLLLARLITGASQGCLFSNDRAIIAAVTPPGKIALGQAVSFTGPGLGITAGLLLGGVLGEVLPWRLVFAVFAAPPVVVALLIAWLVPDVGARPALSAGARRRLAAVAAQRDLWLLGAATGAVMWVQYVLATWAPLLLLEAGVAELGRAGLLASLQGLAGVAGLVGGGWLGDRLQRAGIARRTMVAVTLGVLAAGTLTLGVAVERAAPPPALAAGLFAVALCAWVIWGPTFALLGEIVPGRDLSTAFGLYNAVCVLGALVGPALTGWVRDLTGSFAAGLHLSAGVAVAGMVLALFIRPRAGR
jgi:predicted MFS family arabinose efflux permease